MRTLIKKMGVLLLVAATLAALSCQKQDEIEELEVIVPTDEPSLTMDESNTPLMQWEDLPEELKNAIPLETSHTLIDAIPLENPEGLSTSRDRAAQYVYATQPCYGPGGSPFYIWPTEYDSKIYAIAIRSGNLVDAIAVWYKDSFGQVYFGGAGGYGGDVYVQYFEPNEYIHTISGKCGLFLDRLEIHTNEKSFGYGGHGGSYFNYHVPEIYQFLGFYGAAGQHIDRIGFYVYTR